MRAPAEGWFAVIAHTTRTCTDGGTTQAWLRLPWGSWNTSASCMGPGPLDTGAVTTLAAMLAAIGMSFTEDCTADLSCTWDAEVAAASEAASDWSCRARLTSCEAPVVLVSNRLPACQCLSPVMTLLLRPQLTCQQHMHSNIMHDRWITCNKVISKTVPPFHTRSTVLKHCYSTAYVGVLFIGVTGVKHYVMPRGDLWLAACQQGVCNLNIHVEADQQCLVQSQQQSSQLSHSPGISENSVCATVSGTLGVTVHTVHACARFTRQSPAMLSATAHVAWSTCATAVGAPARLRPSSAAGCALSGCINRMLWLLNSSSPSCVLDEPSVLQTRIVVGCKLLHVCKHFESRKREGVE